MGGELCAPALDLGWEERNGVTPGELRLGVAGVTAEMKPLKAGDPGEVTGAAVVAAEMKSLEEETPANGLSSVAGLAEDMKLLSETGDREDLTGDRGTSRYGSSLDVRFDKFSESSAGLGRFMAEIFADPGGRQIAPLRLNIIGLVGEGRARSGVGHQGRGGEPEEDTRLRTRSIIGELGLEPYDAGRPSLKVK
jgi:hypothetical protein